MKKLAPLAILTSIFLYALGWAYNPDSTDIQRSINGLRSELTKMEDMRTAYKAKKETERKKDEDAYIKQAKESLDRVNQEINQLNNHINNYLEELDVDSREQVGSTLRGGIDELKKATREIGNMFKEKHARVSDGIALTPKLRKSLEQIEKSVTPKSLPPTPTPKITPSPIPPEGTHPAQSSLSDFLPYLIILVLAGLGAFSLWWIDKRLVKLERQALQRGVEIMGIHEQTVQTDGKLMHLTQQVSNEFNAALGELWDNVEKQQSANAILKAEVERLRPAVQSTAPRRGTSESRVALPRHEESLHRASRVPAATTPSIVSVADYLNRAGVGATRAKAVMFRPEVLQAAGNDGPYVLMLDDGGYNIYKVIPGVPRFQSPQDYSHFAHFYDCEQPSSGELLIVEPALAAYDDTARQWTLRQKGRLRIV